MVLALSATVIVIVALLWEVAWPVVAERVARYRAGRSRVPVVGYDPGRERRAEQRARELLRSCVNDEEWGMYRDLGFIRVTGRMGRKGRGAAAVDEDPRVGAHGGATGIDEDLEEDRMG